MLQTVVGLGAISAAGMARSRAEGHNAQTDSQGLDPTVDDWDGDTSVTLAVTEAAIRFGGQLSLNGGTVLINSASGTTGQQLAIWTLDDGGNLDGVIGNRALTAKAVSDFVVNLSVSIGERQTLAAVIHDTKDPADITVGNALVKDTADVWPVTADVTVQSPNVTPLQWQGQVVLLKGDFIPRTNYQVREVTGTSTDRTVGALAREFRAYNDGELIVLTNLLDPGLYITETEQQRYARGDELAAGQHFRRASMYYHFGSHVWHVDEDERDSVHREAVDAFRRAGEYLDPPVRRVEAPYQDFAVPANLRVPDSDPEGGDGDSPLVVLLPGLDSIKEELSAYDADFHDRGVATLAVDGAAQGETWYEQGMTPDYPDLVSAVLDRVQELDPAGVDTGSLGVYGVSLGGFYAPYVAANEDRFDACVGISGPFTVGSVSGRGSDLVREQFLWACKTDSLVEADEITDAMSLRDDVQDLTVPSLMVTGANDGIIPPAQTERIADRAPGGEFVLYEEGNHVCNNIPYNYRPMAASWLRDRLA